MLDRPAAAADEQTRTREIVQACLAMGFALAGVTAARPTEHEAEYRAWLAAGKHGDMDYLEENLEARLDVRALLARAQSVIVVADQYALAKPESQINADEGDPGSRGARGKIAKYARGLDYHRLIRSRLHALCDALRKKYAGEGAEFRTFVDTAPVQEREHAVRSGLVDSENAQGEGGKGGRAFIGKHTLVIAPRVGSYLLLGGIVTTMKLAGTLDDERGPASEACGTCTRCIDACPTSAITPWTVDARRCISYLTLEHRGLIDPAMHEAMGDHLIGCDICQDVCPFNFGEHAGRRVGKVNPSYADAEGLRASLPILDVLGWTNDDRSRVLAASAAKRASLAMIKRNAIIVMGNVLAKRRDQAGLARLQAIASDDAEEAMVRETAQQVLQRLG